MCKASSWTSPRSETDSMFAVGFLYKISHCLRVGKNNKQRLTMRIAVCLFVCLFVWLVGWLVGSIFTLLVIV